MSKIDRLVVKHHVTKDDIEDVAWNSDWNIFEVDIEDAGAVIDVWRTNDEKTEIRVVDDRPIGVRYLILRGANADLIEQQVRGDLDVWSYPEAVEALSRASCRADRIAGMFAVVLTAPEDQDDEVVELVRSLASSADAEARQAFVTATGYRQWPALISTVDEMSRQDGDESVRRNAAVLLEGIRLHGD